MRDRLSASIRDGFAVLQGLRVLRVLRWWPFIAMATLLSWLMGLTIGNIPDQIMVGAVAPYDIRADRQYVLVNEEATEKARAEGVKTVRNVYDHDLSKQQVIVDRIRTAFHEVRAVAAQRRGESALSLAPAALSELRGMFEKAVELKLSDAQWRVLVERQWDPVVEEALVQPVLRMMTEALVVAMENLDSERERGITVRLLTQQAGAAEPTVDEATWSGKAVASILLLDEARSQIQVKGMQNARLLSELAAQLLQANLALNLSATQEARERFLAQFEPITETIHPHQLLARRYEPYDAEQVRRLRAIQRQMATGVWPLQRVGSFLLICVVLLVFHRFGRRYLLHYRPTRKDLFFLASLLTVLVGMMRAGGFMSEALSEGLRLPIPAFAYYYVIPLATGGMMVRFLLHSEIALIFSLMLSALTGILFPHDPSFTAYVLVVNICGAGLIAGADKRSHIIRAGLYTGGIALVMVLAVHLMRAGALGEALTPHVLLWYLLMAFGGAMMSAIVVLALTPLAESGFGYTSNIKLLELANLNHPLLRELVIRAPGTYHHSHLVGILSEAAAIAIGANPLLTRVGAYYHDIGKIRKPMYFAENQKGPSPHERLNPHMSALIIASHVKEGIELAKSYQLPQHIIDMIPQHHGTKMIGYFFEEAKKITDPALSEVSEKDFRYPGPKPQSREAGILLLADGTEGAVRALQEKSPARIQQTVDQIMNKSFAEGQLDECELTLKNLNKIGEAFTRILMGIYHQRVEYPREALQLRDKDVSVVESRSPNATDAPTALDTHRTRSSS